MRNADFAANGTNIDDSSTFSLTHRWQDCHDRVERTPEVCLHCEVEIFSRHHFHRTNLDHAGVVDEHINCAKAIVHRGNHGINLLPVSDIAANNHHFRTAVFEIEPRPVELQFIARAKNEP